MSFTKIVATIGPVSNNTPVVKKLLGAGMSVARLNASHSDLDWHAATIDMIRRVSPETCFLMDIPGKKIRTMHLNHEPTFEVGDELILTTNLDHDGREKVPVSFPDLHSCLSVGNVIMADDGTLCFRVTKIEGQDIYCRADTAGTLKSRKGINVPMVDLGMELVTAADHKMIQFARTYAIDYIGLSFVESRLHIEAIREICGSDGPSIVAKIENSAGLLNQEEIIDAADAIMIDRGDLSVETRFDTVAIEQKRILNCAQRYATPVIVATEMLHSMITSPFPTKAEVADITNAVLDGASAIMLSGETAVGAYPVEAVDVMRSIADSSETYEQENAIHRRISRLENKSIPAAMSGAVNAVMSNLDVSKIVVITKSGFAARVVASARPNCPIIAMTNDPNMARRFNLYRGTKGVYADIPFEKVSANHIMAFLHHAWQIGELSETDIILAVAVAYPNSGNRMNLIQTHLVQDLIETLQWSREN